MTCNPLKESAQGTIPRLGSPLPPTADMAADQRLPVLVDWLEDARRRIASRRSGDYAHDRLLWEPLLAELAAFDDAEVYRHFAASPDFARLKRAWTADFADYAHLRDLARGRAVGEAFARGDAADALSQSMQEYLAREERLLRRLLGTERRDFVMVGCGAAAETFLYYALHSAGFCRKIAVEIDAEAAAMTRRCVDALAVTDAVVRHADGAKVDYHTAEVVLVANFVNRKEAVLRAVADTARPGTLVLVRVPKLLENLLCDSLDQRRVEGWREVGRIAAHYCRMDSVFLRLLPPAAQEREKA